MDYSYVYLILLLPLFSFLILGLAGMKMSHKTAGLIGTTSLGIVTVLSYLTAITYFTGERAADGTFATIVPFNFTWLPLGNLHFDLGFLIDPISAMMLIVISTVSLMVHIYSFGYMHGEKGFQRYYAFLSLFTMSMLGLVVATNIFQMYLFWELVGVSSYLLIGFYYPTHAAVAASKKAFIVTRFADLFFLIGILIFGYYVGSFSFSFAGSSIVMGEGATPFISADLTRAVAAGGFIIPTALVLMFIGGAGKSAMFPLHIWLPDAMEGPTPVSALIHAATMVVAGVFQIARMFPLWIEYAPQYLSIVVVVGVFTAFYAAAVACAQSDIKRVLAFSTISQIAFMMVSLGVSRPEIHEGAGYMASMFVYNEIAVKNSHTKDKTTDNVCDEMMANIIVQSYLSLQRKLYSTYEMDLDKVDAIIADNAKYGNPLNLATGLHDGKVLTSIDTDCVILDSIAKIVTLMFTANQAMLPSPVGNKYLKK